MRILYLSADPGVPVFGHKGASVHLRSMVRAFVELGHDVVVASPRTEAAENDLPGSVGVVGMPAVRPRELADQRELLRAVADQAVAVEAIARETRCNVIYERFSLASSAGAHAARALGLALLLEVNAPLRREERLFRTPRHEDVTLAIEREVLTVARRVFVVSAALRSWLIADGLDEDRIEVIVNAAPALSLRPKEPLPATAQLVVGFSGGLKPWHGIDVLLDGFERALACGANMRLEVAGAGPCSGMLADSRLPPERLQILGRKSHAEALALLAGWDVGVAPYRQIENFYFSPLKLFEYMAAELCPVASDVGELHAILDDGRAGVLVAPDDPDALAAALVALDRDRVRVRVLGRAALEFSRRQPTWTDNAARVLATVAEVEAR